MMVFPYDFGALVSKTGWGDEGGFSNLNFMTLACKYADVWNFWPTIPFWHIP